ncbi:MAG: hypothetical protein OCD76_13170 [Reichenbachiella sp.]
MYTIVTNKRTGVGNKKSVVAIIIGTQSQTIQEVLNKIPLEKRLAVTEVTMYMAQYGIRNSVQFSQ